MTARFTPGRLLGEQGNHDGAAAHFEALVGDASLTGSERVHALAHLAAAHRNGGRPAEALCAARAGVATALGLGDPRAEAHAHLTLASTLMAYFQASADLDINEAMEALERAATIYADLSPLDFAATLLTMAELCKLVQDFDGAAAIFARVARDLSDPKFASSTDVAHHADHLRGRAHVGVAEIALYEGKVDIAFQYFGVAVRLLGAAGGPASATVLEDVAQYLAADPIGDAAAAEHARTIARRC